ncbi:MAG: GNAT family N-acetyltransferase [Flavisolibacter sp.]
MLNCTMIVLHKHADKKGIFYVESDSEMVAELVYSISPEGHMILEHTEVSEQMRGKNVGYELVHAAVDYARAHVIKIIPLCPFAKALFDKKLDFKDVLDT